MTRDPIQQLMMIAKTSQDERTQNELLLWVKDYVHEYQVSNLSSYHAKEDAAYDLAKFLEKQMLMNLLYNVVDKAQTVSYPTDKGEVKYKKISVLMWKEDKV